MTKKTIVILDDEIAVGQTIAAMAEALGLEVRVTQNPDRFFDVLVQCPPDYIVLDLVMPGMDGVEVMRQLAANGIGSGIIISSGVGQRVLNAAERSAVEHGLNLIGVLPKPFTFQHFGQLIQRDESTVDSGIRPPLATDSVELSEKKLLRALQQREFVLAYQPQVSCTSGDLLGIEALVRWHHPHLGLIMPDRFIPLAEEFGLMDAVTRQVMEQALSWFKGDFIDNFGDRMCKNISISINLSAKNLRDIHFADDMSQLCRDNGVPPVRVMMELTETSAMDDPVLSLDLLTRLRVKGFHLSIDDFGTGYSSMLQLVRLPFSEIKVDKSFVGNTARSGESRAAIRSTVELGHSLNMQTTAEGVEDAEAFRYLKAIGCDRAQGYYICKPQYGDDLLKWIDDYDPDRLAAL